MKIVEPKNAHVFMATEKNFNKLGRFFTKQFNEYTQGWPMSQRVHELRVITKELKWTLENDKATLLFLENDAKEIKGVIIVHDDGADTGSVMYAYLDKDIRHSKAGAYLFYVALCQVLGGMKLLLDRDDNIYVGKRVEDQREDLGFQVIHPNVCIALRRIFERPD